MSSIQENTKNDLIKKLSITKHENYPHLQMLAAEDDFDGIDSESMNSRRVSIQEGKDGKIEIVVDNDEPVIFTVFENIDGIRHLFSDSRVTRYY